MPFLRYRDQPLITATNLLEQVSKHSDAQSQVEHSEGEVGDETKKKEIARGRVSRRHVPLPCKLSPNGILGDEELIGMANRNVGDIVDSIEDDEVFGSQLFSEDRRTTTMVLSFGDTHGVDYDVVQSILKTIRMFIAHAESVLGVSAVAERDVPRELKFLVPIMIAVLFLIMIVLTGRITVALIPVVVVGLGILMTLGVVSVFGCVLDQMSQTFFLVSMAIGGAYLVHVTTRYRLEGEMDPDASSRQLATKAIEHLLVPQATATLTTMLAFSALSLTLIPAIAFFGVICGRATLLIALLSVTLAPLT